MQTIEPSNKLLTNLFVRVDRMGVNELHIKEELPCVWLTNLLNEPKNEFAWRCGKPATIELALQPESEKVRLTGFGTFWLNSFCVRCMKDVSFTLTLHFNMNLLAQEKEIQEDSIEMELFDADEYLGWSEENDKEVTEAYYQNRVIDISALIKEQLFLELPSYAVCNHPQALSHGTICELASAKSVAADVSLKKNPFAKLVDLCAKLPENEKM